MGGETDIFTEDNNPTKDKISKKKRPKQGKEEECETTTKKKSKTVTVDGTSKLDIQEEKITPKTVKPKRKKHKKPKDMKEATNNDTELHEEKEKPDVQKLCMQYLSDWKINREKWSFQKVRQVWLLQHMFDENKVPDEDFKILLEYLEGLKGKAREVTIQNAEKLLNDNDSENSDEDDGGDGGDDEVKSETKVKKQKGERLSDKQCDRIRQVLQILP